jgi:hypothetical protein
VLSGQGGGAPVPTPTIAVAAVVPSATTEPAHTPTTVPLTEQLQRLEKDTELRDKAGSDASAQIEGLLPAGSQYFVTARTVDSQWIRIETRDGVSGWIDAEATGLTAEQLTQLPEATTLTRLTDTPTATVPPTDAPTDTPTPQPTSTTGPTRTPAPTSPPASPVPTVPPASPTAPTVSEPLGYGFDVQTCIYLDINYECTVVFWGSGGDGHYNFEMKNPDTGNPDLRLDTGSATYLVRWRRCRTANVDFRIWDNSGNHLEPGFTLDPNSVGGKFPGGACTP